MLIPHSLFRPASRPQAALAAGLVALAFAIPAWYVILSDRGAGRGAYDQEMYHLPAIERYAAEWPRFDFTKHEAAMAPGYHVAVSTIRRFVTKDARTLRLLASLLTLGFFATIAWVGARRMGIAWAIALCAPLVASLYVFSSGAWLVPDNLAWWGVLALLLIALHPRLDGKLLLGAGVILVSLALVRQIHIWAASLVWAAAWLGPTAASTHGPEPVSNRLGSTLRGLGVTLPAGGLVIYFLFLWGGAVPRVFQDVDPTANHSVALNLVAPAFLLALIGIFATFYAGLLGLSIGREAFAARRTVLFVAAVAAAGAVVAVIPQSTFDIDSGRWSGLWHVVRELDVRGISVAGRSPLIVALAAVGSAWLATWWLALDSRDRWIFAAAWLAFTAAQCANPMVWQRYYEPYILLMFAVFATRLPMRPSRPGRWAGAAWMGPLALAVLLAVLSSMALRH